MDRLAVPDPRPGSRTTCDSSCADMRADTEMIREVRLDRRWPARMSDSPATVHSKCFVDRAMSLFGTGQDGCMVASLQGQSKSHRNTRGAFSPGRWMRSSIALGSGARALNQRTPLRW